MNVLANPMHKEAWKGWENGEAARHCPPGLLSRKQQSCDIFQGPLRTVVFYFFILFVLLFIV